ncbi:hypothetical protein [Francisella hispaniensis]|nr:hypothetical protein [Francisella hispaniensis]
MSKKIIEFPKVLKLRENFAKIVEVLIDIKASFKDYELISLDFRKTSNADIETLLCITALTYKLNSFSRKIEIFIENLPKDEKIKRMLYQLGTIDKTKAKRLIDITEKKEKGIRIITGKNHSEEIVNKICDILFPLTKLGNKKLHKQCYFALDEAMANAEEHGYKHISDEWWLCSRETKYKKTFAIYDLGFGIFDSIKNKKTTDKGFEKFRTLASTNKHELIRQMCNGDMKYEYGRGNGITQFAKLVSKQFAYGSLNIYTCNTEYNFHADKFKEYNKAIDGTLIVWSIRKKK